MLGSEIDVGNTKLWLIKMNWVWVDVSWWKELIEWHGLGKIANLGVIKFGVFVVGSAMDVLMLNYGHLGWLNVNWGWLVEVIEEMKI